MNAIKHLDYSEDVKFEIASCVMVAKPVNTASETDDIFAHDYSEDIIIYEDDDEIITASFAPLWTGPNPLSIFLENSSFEEIAEEFSPQLVEFFQENKVDDVARCTVGINVVFEKSYCHYFGAYEYDSYAYIVGIIDTSRSAWNAHRFSYTAINPSYIPG